MVTFHVQLVLLSLISLINLVFVRHISVFIIPMEIHFNNTFTPITFCNYIIGEINSKMCIVERLTT